MTASKQHFQLIADVLNDARADLPTEDMTDAGVDTLAEAFAAVLARTNPRFDRMRFLKACGA